MNLRIRIVFLITLCSYYSYSQDSTVIDSVKRILNKRYEALAKTMDERDLKKILSFKTSDFHSIGPDGKVLDNLTMEEYSRQFITNNIPPYNIKNTILNLRLSDNQVVAVVDVLQESVRKRDLVGKVRDVKTTVLQTETWIYTNKQWKLKFVDNVHDQKRFIDGKRVDPTKPYNPDEPLYDPDTSSVKKQIMLLNQQMEDAFNNNDMNKVGAFYANDGEIVDDSYMVKGRANLDNYWMALKDKGRGWKLTVVEIGGQGEFVYQLGNSDLKYISRGAETRSVTNFVLIWKKQTNGTYKIFRDYLTKTKFEKN